MDRRQGRAFEIFVATFILTYHKNEKEIKKLQPAQRSALRVETGRLTRLADLLMKGYEERNTQHLAHGAGKILTPKSATY